METEITVQVFVDEDEAIKAILGLGFEKLRDFYMNDSYFSRYSTNKLKKMQYKNVIKNSFLVREFIGDDDKVLLIYKNKVIKNDVVLMEEKVNAKLDAKENTVKILKLAGLNNWCNANQHLTIFSKDGFEFALQNVENLGLFIEYEEDESIKGLEPQEKIEKMVVKLKSLGLKLGDDYGCKKPFMILHKG